VSGLAVASGVVVLSVEPQSPAERAGVQVRDVIVEFEGRAVSSVDDLHRMLTESQIGVAARLAVLRPTERKVLEIVPQESPAARE
jgi:S1-C subfamily serine protease